MLLTSQSQIDTNVDEIGGYPGVSNEPLSQAATQMPSDYYSGGYLFNELSLVQNANLLSMPMTFAGGQACVPAVSFCYQAFIWRVTHKSRLYTGRFAVPLKRCKKPLAICRMIWYPLTTRVKAGIFSILSPCSFVMSVIFYESVVRAGLNVLTTRKKTREQNCNQSILHIEV